MAKRKRSSQTAASASAAPAPKLPPQLQPPPVKSSTAAPTGPNLAPPAKPNRRPARPATAAPNAATTDPGLDPTIIDSAAALRASPDDAAADAGIIPPAANGHVSQSALSDAPALESPSKKPRGPRRDAAAKPAAKPGPQGLAVGGTSTSAGKAGTTAATRITCADDLQPDPEAEGIAIDDADADVEQALARPPPVDSDYLPLPWKGRLGYACLNTYLRNAVPPVFSSRTCRIASILEHRHPLKDPSLPEHPIKNRPDRDQPADVARGQAYVEALGLANARDVVKMLQWNDRYGIKFMRLSSEMFPFASHDEYGYSLAPFAADTLADAGRVVARLGHRVTTHPGQFTQLGSPRSSVITASIRDLIYHDELLSLLKLPPQQDRDAVMILHMGGVFGDKAATLDRFRTHYAKLPQSVKNRLVLENDDVSWHVHDLLPVCEELNIPMVLDFHHHNILFDETEVREGTADVVGLFPRIKATWTRKGITQKMHYSESEPQAVTARQRRKHSPRVKTLPPCAPDMDLMIEAKDKEQAVFELMKIFKLPGYEKLADVNPFWRGDDNKPAPKKAAPKKGKKVKVEELDELDEQIEKEAVKEVVPDDEVGMGGPEGRVYWPPGMEEWLRPKKRVVVKKEDGAAAAPAKKAKAKTAAAATTAAVKTEVIGDDAKPTPAKRLAPKRAASAKKRAAKEVPTPSTSDGEGEDEDVEMSDFSAREPEPEATVPRSGGRKAKAPARKSKRAQRISYAEEEAEVEAEIEAEERAEMEGVV